MRQLSKQTRGTIPTGLWVNSRSNEVRDCLRHLKSHKAAGSDGITSELLKYSSGIGVRVLTHLFRAIITTRCVPDAWRQGMVVHLPKGGDTRECSNH